jgi:hypothetical protein
MAIIQGRHFYLNFTMFPHIYYPLTTRFTDNFKDLSNHDFTEEEKRVAAEIVCGLHQQIFPETPSVHHFAQRHNLPRRTVRDWVSRHQRAKVLHEECGRPYSLDEIGITNINDKVETAASSKHPLSQSETHAAIAEEVDNTKRRRNEAPTSPCSDRTIKSIMKKSNIRVRKPQITSPARFKACSDIRMSYTQWIMLKAYTENLPKQLIWNWDATQFVINTSDSDQRVCVINNPSDSTPVTVVGDSPLGCAIKWMHMGSANGEYAPLVLLVAIDELGVDDFEHYKVPGLSQCNQAGSVGHLCFCKTRAGNDAFFEWFIQDIAVKTVENCRTVNRCMVCSL